MQILRFCPEKARVRRMAVTGFDHLKNRLNSICASDFIVLDLAGSCMASTSWYTQMIHNRERTDVAVKAYKVYMEQRLGLTQGSIQEYDYDVPHLKKLLAEKLYKEAMADIEAFY